MALEANPPEILSQIPYSMLKLSLILFSLLALLYCCQFLARLKNVWRKTEDRYQQI